MRGRTFAVAASAAALAVGLAADTTFETLVASGSGDAVAPRADAEAWSVMLYTSGTTAKPKGVPRRQRAERASALAQVAQNLYRTGERTLGVMPLYHTMGVRSLLAMSLVGGAFVCLPRFETARAIDRDPSDTRTAHAQCSMAKLYCSEMAGRVADRAVQVFGGRGYMRENVAERFFRELRVERIWEGTSEIQRMIIARQLTTRGVTALA